MSSAERPEFTHVRPFDEASPEEPRTPLRDALSRLEAAVATIHDSDSFRRFLDAQARFHRYSWANTLLILQQRPDATRVASFRTWLSLGRPVRRGEHGIRIFVPVWPRKPPEEAREDEEVAADRQDRHTVRPPVKADDRGPL